jgi:acylphosphatase
MGGREEGAISITLAGEPELSQEMKEWTITTKKLIAKKRVRDTKTNPRRKYSRSILKM